MRRAFPVWQIEVNLRGLSAGDGDLDNRRLRKPNVHVHPVAIRSDGKLQLAIKGNLAVIRDPGRRQRPPQVRDYQGDSGYDGDRAKDQPQLATPLRAHGFDGNNGRGHGQFRAASGLCFRFAVRTLDDFHREDEPVPRGRYRLDIARRVGIVVEQASQISDVPGQRVITDCDISPTRVQQFVLGDQASRVADKMYQQPKGFGLHGQRLSGALQLKLPFMDLHVRESENRALIARHRFFTPPSEKLHPGPEKLPRAFMTMQLPATRVHSAIAAEVNFHDVSPADLLLRARSPDTLRHFRGIPVSSKCRDHTIPLPWKLSNG